jgi:uncharacterized protein YjbI with pentapeptide repeats
VSELRRTNAEMKLQMAQMMQNTTDLQATVMRLQYNQQQQLMCNAGSGSGSVSSPAAASTTGEQTAPRHLHNSSNRLLGHQSMSIVSKDVAPSISQLDFNQFYTRMQYTAMATNHAVVMLQTDLSGLSMRGLNLSRWDFTDCVLQMVDLRNSKLTGARLCGADLRGANLSGTDVTKADLKDCKLPMDLRSINFTGTDLSGCDLSQCTLKRSVFREASLKGCKLPMDLEGVDFTGCDLSGCELSQCTLKRAVFRESSLKGCKLPMDLEGVDFAGCDLSGCDFRGRNIKEATFVGATLTDCDLSTCINAEKVNFSSCTGGRLPANKLAFDDHINKWMGRQKGSGVRLELLYRASRDGFKARDFHRLCDNKGATVTVIRSNEGYVFGGYADQSWNCSNDHVASSSALLFSLVRPASSVAVKLPLNGNANQTAMYCDSSCGPTFGYGGGHDIAVWDSANNFDSDTTLGYSYTLPDGIEDGTTFFTGARYFQASEVEVYRVVG